MSDLIQKTLPSGWKYKKLHEVSLEINSGTGFPKKFQGQTSGEFPFAKVGDISRCFRSGSVYLKSADNFIDEKVREDIKGRVFSKNTIAFPKIGEALKGNYRVIAACDMLFDNNVMGVTPNATCLNHKYLYYFLKTQDFGRFSKATTVPSIRRGEIEGIDIPVPPIDVQESIVAKVETLFSELDKGVESLKTARQQLKAYRQAVLKHAFEGKLTEQWRQQNYEKLETPEQLFARIQQKRVQRYQQQLEEWKQAVKVWEENGKEEKKPGKPSAYKALPAIEHEELEKLPSLPESWVYVRLTEIATIGSGMSVSKSRKLADPMEVPYLRVANVQRGALVLDEIKTMPVERLSLPALELQKWDILFNEGGDRDKLGRGWVWEKQIEPCITQNHVFRATPYMNDEFHSKFISHWGNTFGRFYFEKSGKQTTNLASINKAVLSKFPVPMPSMEEQRKIIEALDDATSLIDSLENEIEMGLARSETLRQSILKKAFSGQLLRGESVLKNINSSSLVDSVI